MPIVVIVEGLISAGKSTLISSCLVPLLTKKGYRVKVIKEPVDKWVECGILQLFYKDMQRWAYTFQTKAFHDRILEARNVYSYNDADIFIMERSPYSDHIFMTVAYENKQVTEMEYQMYQEWWSLWHKLLPFVPDRVIYLKTDLDTCMERLKSRSREGEITSEKSEGSSGGVSRTYQNQLLIHHDRLFNHDIVSIGPYRVQCSIVCDGKADSTAMSMTDGTAVTDTVDDTRFNQNYLDKIQMMVDTIIDDYKKKHDPEYVIGSSHC